MTHQPMFVYTTKGYLNLSLVQCIKPAERGVVKFVFSENEFIELPEAEAQRVESVMIGELFVFPE